MSLAKRTDPLYMSGWDHPPEATSPNCDTRCHWQTPQRLFTLDSNKTTTSSQSQDQHQPNKIVARNLFCAPIILHQKYVLVASGMTLLLFGNFENNEDPFDELAQKRIDTAASPPVTQFSLCSDKEKSSPDWNDKILQLSFHEETSILYALSMESCIYQLKILVDASIDGTDSIDTTNSDSQLKRNLSQCSGDNSQSTVASNRKPEFTLIHNWVTQNLSATCMTTLHGGGGTGIDTICVGYKTGYIEAWNIHQILSSPPPPKQSGHWATQRKLETKKEVHCYLHWEGYMNDSIRTLSFLFRGSDPQKETLVGGLDNTVDDTKAIQNDGKEGFGTAKEYNLIAVVAISIRTADKGKQHQPTSSMLKVLDLKRIMNDILKPSDLPKVTKEMSLQKYVMADAHSMESIDGTSKLPLSNDWRSPSRAPILESNGSDAACILGSIGTGSQVNRRSCVGITLPNGIVAMLSSSRNDFDTVVTCEKQVLLSYPAIGSGQIDVVEANGKASKYLVACLRGGTCYLIPTPEASDSTNSIATVPFAHDIESDSSAVYIQAFTAGNLVVDRDILPVLIYAWPGGIIDIYSSTLVPSKPNQTNEIPKIGNANEYILVRAEQRALQDLIDNDSLLLLSKIIDEARIDSKHPLLQKEEWKELLEETKRGKATSIENIALDALCSIRHRSLHRILLSLALVDE